jgi:hypothetical protein
MGDFQSASLKQMLQPHYIGMDEGHAVKIKQRF